MKKLMLFIVLAVATHAQAAFQRGESPPQQTPSSECRQEANMLYLFASERDNGQSEEAIHNDVDTKFYDERTGSLSDEERAQLHHMVSFIFTTDALAFNAYHISESYFQDCSIKQQASN